MRAGRRTTRKVHTLRYLLVVCKETVDKIKSDQTEGTTEKKTHDAEEGRFAGICKVVGASSLSTPLDKHRFAYDRHFAGSII